ncbi:MAG: zinc ribbon domain-containing protein [Candidatus Eremiobacterota bacterium]
MEINCPNCGELNVDTKFCINCGRKLTENITSDFASDFSDREEQISCNQSYEHSVRPPEQVIGNDEKFCIVCGQTIKISASTCTYCGATVEPVKNKQEWKQHGIILREEGKGIGMISFLTGLLGLFCCQIMFGPLAIIMGYRAIQYESEKSLGNIGIILGIIDILIVIIVFILKNIH